jgi:23S rRNA (adenine2503-C2)-methyltransferase
MPSPKISERNRPDGPERPGVPDLKDMTREEIEAFIAGLGKETFRSRQIMKWMYRFGATSFEGMTDLSKDFRRELADRARISTLQIRKVQTSIDGTKKILFGLEDGLSIESVLIPGKRDRTLCLSTQAGCRMSCRFCLTGKAGLKRNLRPSEITDQLTVSRFEIPEGPEIDNIVLMGMGEPLDNYDSVLRAIRIMTADAGLGLSKRKITLSTCGLVSGIRRLGEDTCVNLAVSLNAADNGTRSRLMPVNRKYPIESLLDACRGYPMPRRRRITFEYILLEGVNASLEDAARLAKLLRGLRCKINLIAFNDYPGTEFKTPSRETIQAFRSFLIGRRFTAILRASKGADILAACGQLSGEDHGA